MTHRKLSTYHRLLAGLFTVLVASLAPLGCAAQVTNPATGAVSIPVDSARVVADLRYLSSPELAGRATGTAGNEAARRYIQQELASAGVQPFPRGWLQPFASGGVNVVGFVEGTERPGRYIVVTAHFDHLGVQGGQIFHGADDNASGTAALLEIARMVAAAPLANSVIFAAVDAEEIGLRGARAFVADPPVPLDSIALNVNMDMVSRSEANELYAAGTYHYPFLTPLVEATAARSRLTLLRGHDRPDMPARDDWTMLSDHAAFHEAGIPFIYFGVEDHDDYHRPTDTFENTDPGFFVAAVRTVMDFLLEAQRLVTAGNR